MKRKEIVNDCGETSSVKENNQENSPRAFRTSYLDSVGITLEDKENSLDRETKRWGSDCTIITTGTWSIHNTREIKLVTITKERNKKTSDRDRTHHWRIVSAKVQSLIGGAWARRLWTDGNGEAGRRPSGTKTSRGPHVWGQTTTEKKATITDPEMATGDRRKLSRGRRSYNTVSDYS